MPKYSSYPVITSLAAEDVVLVHQDSTNSEKIISYDNLFNGIVDSFPAATTTDAGTMSAADKVKLDGTPTITSVVSPLTLSAGILTIQAASDAQSGYMTAAHYTMLSTASQGSVPTTLVQRGSGSQIIVGGLTINNLGGGSGGMSAIFATFSGNVAAATFSADTYLRLLDTGSHIRFYNGSGTHSDLVRADVDLIQASTSVNTASTLVKRDASGRVELGGVQLGTTTNGRVNKWHWHPVSQVLAGGAPTENINVNIAGTGFSAKPNWGIMIPVNNNLTGTYLITNGSTTASNAVCQFRQIDGTNIVAGTYLAMALFADIQ